MKRILIALAIFTTLLAPTSCTHNNGDIGPWFGIWELTSIYIDGEPDTEYPENVFWAFQSTVIEMIRNRENISYLRSWGTWRQEGDNLELTFTYSDNKNPEGSYIYVPIPVTHLPAGVSVLHIDSLSGKRMTLTYVSPDGHTYTYHLKKQN